MFYNEEAEKMVLAYLLKNARFIALSRQLLKDDFFYFLNLRRLFGAVIRVYDAWHMTMTVEVLGDLMKKSKFSVEEETTFQILFHEISAIEIDEERFNYYVDVLKDLKIKRDISTAVSSFNSANIEGGIGESLLQDLSERVHRMRIDASLLDIKKNFMFEPAFVKERLEDYNRKKQFGEVSGTPFGWKELDEKTGGHSAGHLTLVFSRTGGGKTRALTTFAYNGCVAGRRGMFITIEMSNLEIARLYDARMGRIHFDELKKGRLVPEEEQKWNDLLNLMSAKDDKGLYIVDMPKGCTVGAIEEEISSYEKHYGKLDFVVVDYLMLMDSTERTSNMQDRLGSITMQLKQLARVKQVSILTAIQANRKVADVKGEEVGTEHISLSDQVSAHCNNIIYLYRTGGDTVSNTIQVKLVKFRDGGGIAFHVHADWNTAYIGDQLLNLHMPGQFVHGVGQAQVL